MFHFRHTGKVGPETRDSGPLTRTQDPISGTRVPKPRYNQLGLGTWDPLSETRDLGLQNFQVGPGTPEVGR